MKKIVNLPFEEKPLCIMYQHIAFPLGIIQGNSQMNYIPVVFTKYINCTFDGCQYATRFSLGEDLWFLDDGLIKRYNLLIDNGIYNNSRFELLKLIKKMLSIGFYVEGNCNEKWIPGKYFYNRRYFFHPFILIGYNDIKKVFYSVGFLKDNRFQRFEIKYEDMLQAIETSDQCNIKLQCREYNKDFVFEFDLSKVISTLKKYIEASDDIDSEIAHGIKAIERLKSDFREYNYTDYRYTRGLKEHKRFINLCIKYLIDNKYLSGQKFIECANLVCDIAERVHLLSLKFAFTQSKDLINKITNLINKMISTEKQYLPEVISFLENNS